MKILAALVAALLLSGCATKHAYMSQPESLGPPQWHCDLSNNCEALQAWRPSQLTPVGCLAHTLVTFGHVAWECRKPKDGVAPNGGRWIWKDEAKARRWRIYAYFFHGCHYGGECFTYKAYWTGERWDEDGNEAKIYDSEASALGAVGAEPNFNIGLDTYDQAQVEEDHRRCVWFWSVPRDSLSGLATGHEVCK